MNQSETSQTILVAAETDAGTRIDAWLAAQLTDISRSAIQRGIEQGDVTVNDLTVRPSYRVRTGDLIEVELPEATPLAALPENIPLDIVFEDDAIIVINKPAGMVVHPGAGISSGTLANALVYHLREPPDSADAARPGIIHRLDVGTSGLIVAAKTSQAHLHLAAQFADRTVQKTYLALVYGSPAAQSGTIDAPIGRDPRNRVKMSVRPPGQGRKALTTWRVSERFSDFALLEVKIKTGRTHQIRVHLAHMKHPVTGDSTYDQGRAGNIKDAGLRAAIEKLNRPFLHAHHLSFQHPATGREMTFTSPLPGELGNFLQFIRS